jgi:hypothetical protein
MAAFSRYPAALDWGLERVMDSFGPVAQRSEVFEFRQTRYYENSMGPGLRKVFWTFQRLVDPGCLPELKLRANAWERQYAALARHPEPRPLNLDPGYLCLGKLILASTKDFAHRIYLDKGIYAETTLFYRHGRWEHHQWTFPDYRRADFQQFFSQARDYLHRRLQAEQSP